MFVYLRHSFKNYSIFFLSFYFFLQEVPILDKFHHYAEKGFASEEEFFFADHDRKVLNLCKKKQLDTEVVNFLYRSDADDTSVSAKHADIFGNT